MNPERSKLKQQQDEAQGVQNQSRQQSMREFGSVEELLRHDATQVNPPPGLTARINVSLVAEPKPSRPWWRRFLPGR